MLASPLLSGDMQFWSPVSPHDAMLPAALVASSQMQPGASMAGDETKAGLPSERMKRMPVAPPMRSPRFCTRSSSVNRRRNGTPDRR